MAWGDDVLFVGTRRAGTVYVVQEALHGESRVHALLEGLSTPNGLAFSDGDLFVAETHRIYRYDDILDHLDSAPEPELIAEGLVAPGANTMHGWKYLAFGPDGKLYVNIGVPCNVNCANDTNGLIIRMDADGSHRETVARGVRQSVGLAWHPDTDELWFTENGRDRLGDDVPPDELNRVSEVGQHFGFPFCHGGYISDPEVGDRGRCEDSIAPAQNLGAHVAPLGLLIYAGGMFPSEYRGDAFIAEHGSWDRSERIGYRVSRVQLQGSTAVGYETFAAGWLQGDTIHGRPVDLMLLDDGSMLVSDDVGGVIYRISYAR